jgi:hypothetical protein
MAALNRVRKLAWPLVPAIAAFAFIACAPAFCQDDDPPPQAARLSALNGTVSIQAAGADDWGQAFLNLPLGPGDRIVTDADGRAEIQLERVWLRVGPNTDVTLVDASASALTFGVAQGSVIARTQALWPDQSIYVQTPSGTVTITQPSGIRVDVMPSDQAAVFSDRWGPSYVSGAGDFSQSLSPGQALELVGTNPVSSQWLAPINGDEFEAWNEQRNESISRAASWKYLSPDMPGGEDLDAAGEWTPASDYGPVWFPRVEAGWAPYRHGHWAHRDPWGWVWVAEEPWGYAPFHFGRWVVINGRWGWIPGPREAHPIWSPALVVFVGGGGPGMSAWIPLGPGEPFRPWYRCSPRYVDAVNISNIRPAPRVVVQRTYINITTVTNITYVNRTAGVTVVRQDDFASGRPVARAVVRVNPEQFSAHINVVVAPQAPARPMSIVGAPAARPARVATARPVMINAKGQMATAQPHAQAVAPPVKPVAAPRPLAGRTAVAPPPNAKPQPPQQGLQPGVRQGNQPAAPGNHPGQPGQQPLTKPAPQLLPPAQTQQKPTQPAAPDRQPQQPQTKPAPAAQPSPQPQAKPQQPPAKPQPGQPQPKDKDKNKKPAPTTPPSGY